MFISTEIYNHDMNVFICLYLLISSISVNICQYLSICKYLFLCLYLYVSAYICQYVCICLYVCICASRSDLAVKAATVSNSTQTVQLSLQSLLPVYICLYRPYLCISVVSDLYPYIYAYICSYLLIQFISGPGPIARTNLTGTNLRDQADNHSCAYVLILVCDNLCVYQTYVCTYVLISGHICLYPKT